MRMAGHRGQLLLLALPLAKGFYLPGVAPHDFQRGEKVELKVNKLTSTRTQVPYEYYSLPFCMPKNGVEMSAENLGEFLTGDRIDNSPYQLYMRDDSYCNLLCQQKYTKKDVDVFKKAIAEEYHHNWIIDNLPAASVIDTEEYITTSYSRGFPVGYTDATKGHYLYNHVNIIIKYHELSPDENRVVGFYVEPFSVKHSFMNGVTWSGDFDVVPPLATCDKTRPMDLESIYEKQKVSTGTTLFTYDVIWRPSSIHWASRWDIYLSMDNAVPDKVHWFSIVNSLLIVIFLTGMIGMILVRNVHRDISRYNRVPTEEEKQEEREESGWKLVHADVFRPPANMPLLFCVFVGTGLQLFWMTLITICFAAIGFLSPANRGSLMIAMLLLYVVMGAFAGYQSANLYKTFQGRQWQRCTLLTAFLYPGVCFIVFFIFNGVLWSYGSSGAVPVLSMVAIISLWFGISVPLVFLGAYVGFRKDKIEFPIPYKVDSVPREIPEQPWYLGTGFTIVIGGILPFGACFVELFFILSSMWMDQYYYVFGFLLLVFFILCVTCAEITMVLVYFQLCSEDYNWWWRSFMTSGSTAFYVFLYSAFYFSKLEANLTVTYFIYFGYMTIICFGMFLVTGLMGYSAALWFTKKIYGSIKVD
jgi:transmembrane 9 superfamily protein 2/4